MIQKLKITLLVSLLFLLVPISCEVEIALYKHTVTLDTRIREDIKITFVNKGNRTVEQVQVNIPRNSWGWRVYNEKNQPLDFWPGATTMNITFRKPLKPKEIGTVKLSYFSRGRRSNIGGFSKFSYSLSNPYASKNVYFTVKLPPGKVILRKEYPLDPISPERYSTGSDGRSILINWYFPSLKESKKLTIWFESAGVMDIYLMIGVVVFVIIVLSLVVFRYFRPKKVISLSLLKEDERKIIETVMEEKEITQKELKERLDFSKAKLSRLLRDLEERGIVKKEPYHRTNMVSLKKRLKE